MKPSAATQEWKDCGSPDHLAVRWEHEGVVVRETVARGDVPAETWFSWQPLAETFGQRAPHLAEQAGASPAFCKRVRGRARGLSQVAARYLSGAFTTLLDGGFPWERDALFDGADDGGPEFFQCVAATLVANGYDVLYVTPGPLAAAKASAAFEGVKNPGNLRLASATTLAELAPKLAPDLTPRRTCVLCLESLATFEGGDFARIQRGVYDLTRHRPASRTTLFLRTERPRPEVVVQCDLLLAVRRDGATFEAQVVKNRFGQNGVTQRFKRAALLASIPKAL